MRNMLTEEQVAERYRFPLRTLRKMRRAGTGPRFFKGPKKQSPVLYAEQWVDSWLDARAVTSTAEALYSAGGRP